MMGTMALVVTGCKKDEEAAATTTPTPTPTKTELLTGKNWKITAATIDPAIDWNDNGTLVTDIYAQLAPCEQDDLTKFNTNFTVTEDEGAIKCDSLAPQTTNTAIWAWSTNETVLTIDNDGTGPNTPDSLDVLELTATKFKANQTLTLDTVNYVFTITLTKQ